MYVCGQVRGYLHHLTLSKDCKKILYKLVYKGDHIYFVKTHSSALWPLWVIMLYMCVVY